MRSPELVAAFHLAAEPVGKRNVGDTPSRGVTASCVHAVVALSGSHMPEVTWASIFVATPEAVDAVSAKCITLIASRGRLGSCHRNATRNTLGMMGKGATSDFLLVALLYFGV
jgi:hypothetical protein